MENKGSTAPGAKIHDRQLWTTWGVVALSSEFLGSVMLTVLVNGSIAATGATVLEYALTHGFVYLILGVLFGHRSGAHLNPAISLAQVLTRRIGLMVFLCYVAAQVVGCIAGAALLNAMTGGNDLGNLGVSTVNSSLSAAEGFACEFLAMLLIVLSHFSLVNWHKSPTGQYSEDTGALYFATTVVAATLFAARFSGAGLNPARVFGASVIANKWDDHWIYWVGPFSAAIGAALLHVLFDEFGGARPVRVIKAE